MGGVYSATIWKLAVILLLGTVNCVSVHQKLCKDWFVDYMCRQGVDMSFMGGEGGQGAVGLLASPLYHF